jgi:RNA polymerase sigma factor (TIGR02999 family)
MSRERPGHLLQTSALINEAYLRLIDWKNVRWQNRAHFFGVAAQLMRRILVDFARERQYLKRGGGTLQVSLSEAASFTVNRNADLVALDEALTALAEIDLRKARVVEMRFFAGLSVEEVADVLRISKETVTRDWRLAKVWLLRELGREIVVHER